MFEKLPMPPKPTCNGGLSPEPVRDPLDGDRGPMRKWGLMLRLADPEALHLLPALARLQSRR